MCACIIMKCERCDDSCETGNVLSRSLYIFINAMWILSYSTLSTYFEPALTQRCNGDVDSWLVGVTQVLTTWLTPQPLQLAYFGMHQSPHLGLKLFGIIYCTFSIKSEKMRDFDAKEVNALLTSTLPLRHTCE